MKGWVESRPSGAISEAIVAVIEADISQTGSDGQCASRDRKREEDNSRRKLKKEVQGIGARICLYFILVVGKTLPSRVFNSTLEF